MVNTTSLEEYVQKMDEAQPIMVYEGCTVCNRITIRIPHTLLRDMLINCEQSAERDILITKLKEAHISDNLKDMLEKNHIFEKIS